LGFLAGGQAASEARSEFTKFLLRAGAQGGTPKCRHPGSGAGTHSLPLLLCSRCLAETLKIFWLCQGGG